jgi:hypothetical protein
MTWRAVRTVADRGAGRRRTYDSSGPVFSSTTTGISRIPFVFSYLTHKGVFIDAGRIADAVADELRKEVFNAYPKPTDGPYIADAIIAHGQRSPAAAPPGSLAAHLILQQRQLEHRHR